MWKVQVNTIFTNLPFLNISGQAVLNQLRQLTVMRRIQRSFRVYQVFNVHASEMYQNIAIQVLVLGEGVAIASTYAIIRLPASLGIGVGISAFFVAVISNICTIANMIDMSSVTSASIRFSRLMSSPEINQLSKHDNKFFKSCYPLKFSMRNFFTVSDATVGTVFQDIYVSSVINLLLLPT